jgi:DNA-binding transcriptional MerR regulator
MSALEQVRQMQSQGIPEDQIIQNLQNQGIPYKDISNALAQNKIKAAVVQDSQSYQQTSPPVPPFPTATSPSITPPSSGPTPPQANSTSGQQMPQPYQPNEQTIQSTLNQRTGVTEISSSKQNSQMQQSMLPPPSQQMESPDMIPMQQDQASPQEQPIDLGYEQYPQETYEEEYMPYEYTGSVEGISTDTIAEISEQIVSEKISEIRKHLEKIMDFKTSIETKTELLEERLKRMEKIIDELQSSVLKKVGDYTSNIDDIKQELIATQKSFTMLVPNLRSQSRPHTKIAKKARKTHRKKKK